VIGYETSEQLDVQPGRNWPGNQLHASPGSRTGKKMNALSVIFPYRLEGVWVFDDAATGLVREPFISGADNILDLLISIPVSALLEPNCFAAELKKDGRARMIYHLRYQTLDIWGATARILKQLLEVAYGFGQTAN
jgi:hypothetical protein